MWSLLSPYNDESGEPIFIGEKSFWQDVFTLLDHLQLCSVNKLNLPLHAAFITLTDNGYDEVHKYYVPDNQNEEPEEPCEDLEFFRAVNYWRGVVVTDGLAQSNHEKCSWLDSTVGLFSFIHYDIGHDSEASNHKKEEE